MAGAGGRGGRRGAGGGDAGAAAVDPRAARRRAAVEKIEEDCDRDFFMTPEEAKDYGIIDEARAAARPARPPAPSAPDVATRRDAPPPQVLASKVRVASPARPELLVA